MRKADWSGLMPHGTYLFYLGGVFLAYTLLAAEGIQKEFFAWATGILITLGTVLILEGIFRFCERWLKLSSLTILLGNPKKKE